MKALVTGATGFVGSHLARLLIEKGHQVRILRRATSRLDAIRDLDVEHYIGDLDDPDSLGEALEGIDWVFHTAAVADYWRSGKAAIYRVNVNGTRALLEAALAAKVKRFIFTSSGAAVGWRSDGHAADENVYFNVDPNLSAYGHSKFLAEAEVHKAIQRGLDAVILNPTIILGPGDLNLISGTIILELVRGTLMAMPETGGSTFIDVRDVVKAHLAAAEKGRCGGRYLLGAVNMSHKAMIKLTASIVGMPAPKIPAPKIFVPIAAALIDLGRTMGLAIPAEGNQIRLSQRNLYFDCSKSWRELCQPEIPIQQSIAETYQWYRENGYL